MTVNEYGSIFESFYDRTMVKAEPDFATSDKPYARLIAVLGIAIVIFLLVRRKLW